MNQPNRITGFDGFYPRLAARTAPAPRFATRRPAELAPLELGLGRWLGILRQALERRRERARTQRALAQLDDRLLRDIGVSRADLRVRLDSPFAGLGETLTRERTGLWHL
jgi:uncharacterized protein YjiS (DUF1127 family)